MDLSIKNCGLKTNDLKILSRGLSNASKSSSNRSPSQRSNRPLHQDSWSKHSWSVLQASAHHRSLMTLNIDTTTWRARKLASLWTQSWSMLERKRMHWTRRFTILRVRNASLTWTPNRVNLHWCSYKQLWTNPKASPSHQQFWALLWASSKYPKREKSRTKRKRC